MTGFPPSGALPWERLPSQRLCARDGAPGHGALHVPSPATARHEASGFPGASPSPVRPFPNPEGPVFPPVAPSWGWENRTKPSPVAILHLGSERSALEGGRWAALKANPARRNLSASVRCLIKCLLQVAPPQCPLSPCPLAVAAGAWKDARQHLVPSLSAWDPGPVLHAG